MLGPSGCGKSTLLKCIAGLEPTLRRAAHASAARRSTRRRPTIWAWSSSATCCWTGAPSLDNVLMPAEFCGEPPRGTRPAPSELLELFGLDGFEYRYPWELSGGMRQRVAICRALLTIPSCC